MCETRQAGLSRAQNVEYAGSSTSRGIPSHSRSISTLPETSLGTPGRYGREPGLAGWPRRFRVDGSKVDAVVVERSPVGRLHLAPQPGGSRCWFGSATVA